MRPLYNLADNFIALKNFIDTTDEEEIDEESITAMLDDISEDIESKCINIAAAIKNIELYITATKTAKSELAERQRKLEKKVSHLSDYLITNMYNKLGVSRIGNDLFNISIYKCPPSVKVIDDKLLPINYTKIEITPDKFKIRESLQKGELIPGVELIQNVRLSIK